MSDYIRREDAVEALDGKIIVTGHENADAVLQYMKDISNKIKSLEPADVVPLRHARWRHYEGMYACEACGAQLDDESPFCPMCGAKMDAHGPLCVRLQTRRPHDKNHQSRI